MSDTHNLRRGRVHRRVAMLLGCALIAGVLAMIAYWKRGESSKPSTAHDVPLGVEEAVIIRYEGPRLAAKPYRRGVSVNVRIADEARRGELSVYDVRYVVSLPGEFDLKDYLTTTEGAELANLPSFQIRGLTTLTKDIETRIREIEDVEIAIWHGYYETLWALGGLWLLWLVGLIYIGRPKRVPQPPAPPPEPTLREQIVGYFAAIDRGELTAREKARLEILLLRYWRERFAPEAPRMSAACSRLHQHANVQHAYETVERWLHAPAPLVAADEVVSACTPLLNDS